jgi:VanZ family protein
MPKLRSFIIYWLPVLVWMACIFSASSDQMSFQHSSRLIGPLIRWLFPQISDHALASAVFVVRKCAHLTEYAILAWLLWRAIRKPIRGDTRPWRWSEAFLVVGLVALYASTDEFHQTFVPSRQGSVWDVLLDTTGAAVGMLFLWIVGRWSKNW